MTVALSRPPWGEKRNLVAIGQAGAGLGSAKATPDEARRIMHLKPR